MTKSPLKHAWRDFFRRRRVNRHVARHGDRYFYHGLEVRVPKSIGVGLCNALMKQKYERDEAAMIMKHLPPDLPVIELGGSLGVVSRLVRSRLAPGVRHLIVEANPNLLDVCRKNASRDVDAGLTEVVHAAVSYDGPIVRFGLGRDVHSNALASGRDPDGETIVEVETISLSALVERAGNPDAYVLVCDIEGAEAPIFERDREALARARVAIIEIHPKIYAACGTSQDAVMNLIAAAGFKVADSQRDVLVLVRD